MSKDEKDSIIRERHISTTDLIKWEKGMGCPSSFQ